MCCNFSLLAQDSTKKSLADRTKGMKDIGDYYRQIFHKKATIDTTKRKTLGPFYTPVIYPGYSLVTGTLLGLSNNVSFYTHAGADAKISTVITDIVYTEFKQSINIMRSSLWLNHERINLLGDWRFYKFPTFTYGLGGKTLLADANAVDYSQLRIYEVAVKQVTDDLLMGVGYNLDSHWNLKETNNPALVNTDLDKYGFSDKSISSGISLNLVYDNRLNSNSPADGYYVNVQLRDNLKLLGSDNNWQSATLDFRHYIPLSKRRRSILAFWSYDVFTLGGNPPYFDMPSIGGDTFNNSGRGYAEGRFRGLNMMYFETEYRYDIVKNGFIGGVAFANVSTFSEIDTKKFEKINAGYGMGIRIKMNKNSNTNLGIDYVLATNGVGGFSFTLNELF